MNSYSTFFKKYNSFLPLLILLLILPSGFISASPILTVWESIIFYYNFASLETPLDFAISSRGAISDPAIFLLGLSRIIIDFLEFYPSVTNFRLLTVIYGICILMLFFVILKLELFQ